MGYNYTKEQIAFIKKHYTRELGRHEFMLMFNKKFNTNKASNALYDKAKRLGVLTDVNPHRANKYTEEQEEYIKKKYNNPLNGRAFTAAFNAKFNTNYSNNGIKEKAKSLGMTHSEHYTDEQLNFLKENSDKYSRQELTDLFNKKFNQNRNYMSIIGACTRRGYKLYVVHNPGDVIEDGGYLRIKLSKEENKLWKKKTGWASFAQYIYWKETGHLPKSNELIVYLDGNTNNCDIENLYLIDSKSFARLRRQGWINIDHPKLKKLAIEQCKIETMVKENK